ncbi:acyl-ACP--UDP-N-acetylglucosamine O-acyltransferase [Pontibacter cellulosilyticus]|uniref:Acyl-ACP--UDP-N-acetylglucosamine O-acyltransferase n=1 Tax=Pontibacter cellulosilyticus TaxID=1720253 RepID=A0A923SIZ0_9BACT|nr:acyl-ACP--UDP-N-acetylglucosamine O-acyltransferase [Pontibacter cellulosilyticus]MBC5993339.1 acyl-ACP--UDP-N-acetylglucosamine O-acyltransferase [Pontibacter cellulosilyticus]
MNQPLAYVHPEAKIAQNVVIEPFASIHKNVEIGEGTWIGPNAVIMEGARIGKNCKIFPGAVVSSVPQDLKFAGEVTTTHIGDNTVIRECVTVSRGTIDKMKTVIGKNCLIMAYAHVAHDCIVGDNCIVGNAVQMAGHVEVGDHAIISAATLVHQFAKVGTHAMVSGGSLILKDVPPFVKAAREPLAYAGINSVGLRRRGFTSEQINEVQQIYRILFISGLNNSQALDKIELELSPSKERDEVVNFIRNSGRGIIRSYFSKDAN